MRYYLIVVLVGIFINLSGQSPLAFNYQGLARGLDGSPLVDQEISLYISLVSGDEDGIVEYEEEHFIKTNDNGLFSIRIGEGIQVFGNVANIDWGANSYFIRTEMDPNGGEEYVEMGTSQLLSVPYALYAAESGNTSSGGGGDQTLQLNGTVLSIENGNSVNLSPILNGIEDDDADPTNEIQTLQLSGQTLTLSGANSIMLPSGGSEGTDNQTLTLNGTLLSIESGNSVNLSPILNGIEDDDADPTNEIQTLQLVGQTLTLSGANSVTLPTVGSGGSDNQTLTLNGTLLSIANGNSVDLAAINSNGGGGDGIWQEFSEGSVTYEGQNINLGIKIHPPVVQLGIDDESAGFLRINHLNSSIARITKGNQGGGFLAVSGPSGSTNVSLTSLSGDPDLGYISVRNSNGDTRSAMYVDAQERGRLFLRGPSGNTIVRLTSTTGDNDYGWLGVMDNNGNTRGLLNVEGNGTGNLEIYGKNGNRNVAVTSLASNQNNGIVAVYNANGDNKAGIYVNDAGQGRVYADNISSFHDNPEKSGERVAYSYMQGPESAMYMRGTGRLTDGVANITLPKHFSYGIDREGMTIVVTPLSADSKGIAVISKRSDSFDVQELWNGEGNYEFDWEVKALRKGYNLKNNEINPLDLINKKAPLQNLNSTDAEANN